jgi:hypothetical protein
VCEWYKLSLALLWTKFASLTRWISQLGVRNKRIDR